MLSVEVHVGAMDELWSALLPLSASPRCNKGWGVGSSSSPHGAVTCRLLAIDLEGLVGTLHPNCPGLSAAWDGCSRCKRDDKTVTDAFNRLSREDRRSLLSVIPASPSAQWLHPLPKGSTSL